MSSLISEIHSSLFTKKNKTETNVVENNRYANHATKFPKIKEQRRKGFCVPK
jgi:hypothetical protein